MRLSQYGSGGLPSLFADALFSLSLFYPPLRLDLSVGKGARSDDIKAERRRRKGKGALLLCCGWSRWEERKDAARVLFFALDRRGRNTCEHTHENGLLFDGHRVTQKSNIGRANIAFSCTVGVVHWV